MTTAKDDEHRRLTDCFVRIDASLSALGLGLSEDQTEIQAAHDHMWEQQRALNVLQGALADVLRSPGDIGNHVDDALEDLFTGPEAVFSPDDREEVLIALQNRLGRAPEQTEQTEQTEQIVRSLEARVEGAIEDVSQKLGQMAKLTRRMAIHWW